MKLMWCTCIDPKDEEYSIKIRGYDHLLYRQAEVDKDGVCLDCGYYAMKEVNQRSESEEDPLCSTPTPSL